MRRGSRARRLSRLAVAALVLLAVLAQVLLPIVAASKIRSRVGRYGRVESVSVSAFPAVKLLWGDADSVTVKAGSLALTPSQAAALLWESRGVGRMNLSAVSVRVGGLALERARLRKRGDSLSAQAITTGAQVQAALPEGVGLTLLGSGEGKVRVQATGALFGVQSSVEAVGEASEGKLVGHPVGLFLEDLRLTLFSDPHVAIDGVGARVVSRQPLSYALSMSAILR